MSATVAIIRYKSKVKNGKAPLAIRITKSGERAYIFLKHFLRENEWDRAACATKEYPNSRRINIKLSEKFSEAEKVILEAEENDLDLTPSQLKESILSGGYSFVSFNKLANEYLDAKLKAKKFSQYTADRSKLYSFIDFIFNERKSIGVKNSSDDDETEIVPSSKIKKNIFKYEPCYNINVKNISGPLLKDYKNHLLSLGQKKNTLYNKLNIIRIVFNKAIGLGTVDYNKYPFGKGPNQIQIRPGESMKVGFEENELDIFEEVDLSENNPEVLIELNRDVTFTKNIDKKIADLNHARNIFMFSFYFAGVRISDVLRTRWSDFKNGRYYYYIGKNDRPTDVPIPEQVSLILSYYESDKRAENDYVFPELKKAELNNPKDIHTKLRTGNSKINDNLEIIVRIAKLNKKTSIHHARHAFGNHAKGNVPTDVLKDLYRHAHLSTTINYQQNWTKKEQLDSGLMTVINLRKKKETEIIRNAS